MEDEYIDNKLQGKVPKFSKSFCVQNHLSGQKCSMLIEHDNRTRELSNKR
jgi:hypothetical protein